MWGIMARAPLVGVYRDIRKRPSLCSGFGFRTTPRRLPPRRNRIWYAAVGKPGRAIRAIRTGRPSRGGLLGVVFRHPVASPGVPAKRAGDPPPAWVGARLTWPSGNLARPGGQPAGARHRPARRALTESFRRYKACLAR